MKQVRVAMLASFVSVALAACNGGGGGGETAPTAQPSTGEVSAPAQGAVQYAESATQTAKQYESGLCLAGPIAGVSQSGCAQTLGFADGFAGVVAGHAANKGKAHMAPMEIGQSLIMKGLADSGSPTSRLIVSGKPVLIRIPAGSDSATTTAPDIKLTIQSGAGFMRVVILKGNGRQVTEVTPSFSNAWYYNLSAQDVNVGTYTVTAEIVGSSDPAYNAYGYADRITDTFVVQPALKPLTVEINPVVVTNANTNTTYPIVADSRTKTWRDANGKVTAEINELPDLPNLNDLQEILNAVLPFQQVTVRQAGASSIVVKPANTGYKTQIVAYNNASGNTTMPTAQSSADSSRPEYSASVFEVWKSALGFNASNAIGNVVQVGVTSYDFPMLAGFDFDDTPAGGEWPRVVIRGGNFFWTNILGTLFHSTGLKWTNTSNYGTNYSKNLELTYVNESAIPAYVSGDKVVIGMSPAMQKLGGSDQSHLVLNRVYSFGQMGGTPFYPDEASTKIQQMDAWALKQFYQKLQAMGF